MLRRENKFELDMKRKIMKMSSMALKIAQNTTLIITQSRFYY